MFVRVLFLTAIIANFAFTTVLQLAGPAVLVGAVAGLVLLRDQTSVTSTELTRLGNPINIIPALGFLILVAIMAVAARWAEIECGGSGTLALIITIGLFDVDTAIVTLGGLSSDAINPGIAGLALVGAVLANMLVKLGVIIIYAGPKAGRNAILALTVSAVTLASMIGFAMAT
jgi:uncharacterized membrane protein (DUF4010 family)